MKKGLTELVFILDRSGSMYPLAEDFVNGFNSLIEHQKSLPGETLVTTVLFSTKCRLLHDRIPIGDAFPMTCDDYKPCGVTSLLDAVGEAVNQIGILQDLLRSEYIPERTLFVICTDGGENDSAYFIQPQVCEMVKSRHSEGWDFVFLGVGENSEDVAEFLGIEQDFAAIWSPDKMGVTQMFTAADRACTAVRAGETLDSSWAQTDVPESP